MNLSLLELWGTMGWFARGIVFTLLAMSVLIAMVAVRKLVVLARARRETTRFAPKFSAALDEEDFATAAQLVEEHPRSHLASIFRRVFSQLARHAEDKSLSATEVTSLQRQLELNSLEQLSRFRRGLGLLATVGATAPFVGLLGTVMGVVNAFTGMALSGSGGLSAISAGIAEALITTAAGLIVAIPAVWFYNYFINRIDFISMEVTYATKEFADFLLRYEAKLVRGPEDEGSAALLSKGAGGSRDLHYSETS